MTKTVKGRDIEASIVEILLKLPITWAIIEVIFIQCKWGIKNLWLDGTLLKLEIAILICAIPFLISGFWWLLYKTADNKDFVIQEENGE